MKKEKAAWDAKRIQVLLGRARLGYGDAVHELEMNYPHVLIPTSKALSEAAKKEKAAWHAKRIQVLLGRARLGYADAVHELETNYPHVLLGTSKANSKALDEAIEKEKAKAKVRARAKSRAKAKAAAKARAKALIEAKARELEAEARTAEAQARTAEAQARKAEAEGRVVKTARTLDDTKRRSDATACKEVWEAGISKLVADFTKARTEAAFKPTEGLDSLCYKVTRLLERNNPEIRFQIEASSHAASLLQNLQDELSRSEMRVRQMEVRVTDLLDGVLLEVGGFAEMVDRLIGNPATKLDMLNVAPWKDAWAMLSRRLWGEMWNDWNSVYEEGYAHVFYDGLVEGERTPQQMNAWLQFMVIVMRIIELDEAHHRIATHMAVQDVPLDSLHERCRQRAGEILGLHYDFRLFNQNPTVCYHELLRRTKCYGHDEIYLSQFFRQQVRGLWQDMRERWSALAYLVLAEPKGSN